MADEQKKDSKKAGKSKSPMGMIVGITVLLLLCGGAYLGMRWYSLTQPMRNAQAAGNVAKPPPGNTVPLEVFLVNLRDPEDYIYKVDIKLNVLYPDDKKTEDQVVTELRERNAQIRDLINEILLRLSKSELDNDPDRIYRHEIKRKINQVLATGEINDVYIEDLIIPG